MKKKPTEEVIPEFRAKYHPDFNSIPHPNLSAKEQRNLIYRYFIKDLDLRNLIRNSKNETSGTLFYGLRRLFREHRTDEDIKDQDEFDVAIRKFTTGDDRQHWTSPRIFLDWVGKEYSFGFGEQYLSEYSDEQEEQTDLMDRYGKDGTGALEIRIEAEQFANIFQKYGIKLDYKIPLFYLAAIAIYEGILPNYFGQGEAKSSPRL